MQRFGKIATVLLAAMTLSSMGLAGEPQDKRPSTSSVPLPRPRIVPVTQKTEVLWFQQGRGQSYQQALASLSGERDLDARVVQVRGPEGPQSIIVIYNDDGGCRICIGKASACKEACPRADSPTSNPTSNQ